MTAPKGIFLLQGKVENITPLHIGSGSDDRSDMDILLDLEGLPYIPATAFVGVILNSIRSSTLPKKTKTDEWRRFWGCGKTNDNQKKGKGIGYQSQFRPSDLVMIRNNKEQPSFTQTIRDGIKIDSTRGMVEDKGKYDYELLDAGTIFKLNAEFSFEDTDKAFVEEMVSTIISLLTQGNIYIGKMTNSGFGQIRLLKETTSLYLFDFEEKDDVLAWLFQDFSKKSSLSVDQLPEPISVQSGNFRINAKFQLKSSLLIRTYSAIPNYPDTVHLKSNNKWIIPAASLKGAIRARAERIAKTISSDNNRAQEFIDVLFGQVDVDKSEKREKKGKVRISEIVLPDDYPSKIQTRIKIDRFTGGTIDGSLLETMPLFSKDDVFFKLEITVFKCNEAEAGLLLLVLKDLWSGDLAVGGEKNIGRGLLKGLKADIHYKGDRLIIPKDINQIDETHKSTLLGLVEEFNTWMKN